MGSAVTVAEITMALGLPMQSPTKVIRAGQNNFVYDFGTVIVRVPHHADAQRNLEREAEVLGALRPHLPVPVPELSLRKVGKLLVSVHTRIAGLPLPEVTGMSTKTQRVLASDMANFLKALHSLPAEFLPSPTGSSPSDEWHALLNRCEALAFPRLPVDTVAYVRQCFRGFLAICDTLPRAIIHGDFGTGNILVQAGRLSGVIDFAACGFGDPAYDFASPGAGFGDAFAAEVMK